jgi:hypothetical protein
MPYSPQTWVDSPSTASPIDASHLNHVESGISSVASDAATAQATANANNAYADAKAITSVAATATANFTATVGKLTPVDCTSGAITVTLPSATGNAGGRLHIQRIDASVNTVTISGTIRGSASTITLALQFEDLELVSNGSGSWWPAAGNKTLGSLDARYSTTGVAASNYTTLIQFYAALANRENGKCDIIYGPGDSLGEGYPATSWERTPAGWAQQLMRQRFPLPKNPVPSMSAVGNDRGFIGVPGSAILGFPGNNPFPWTFTGGTNNSTSGWGAKFASWFGTAAGHKAVLAVPSGGLTSFEIHHVTGASGGASGAYYKIDGGSAVVFSTSAGSTTAAKLVVNSAVTTSIEVGFNGTGGVLLTGIREYSNTEAASIHVHNCCIGGAQTSTWTATHPTGGWLQAQANLNPDLYVIELGGNEFLNAIASSTFKTNMLALLVLIRAAGMTCPVVLSLPYNGPPTVGGGEPLTAFVARAKEIAAADPTVLVLDNSVRMPATNAANTFSLYYTDNVHGAANGNAYALMAESLAATISPQ